MHQFELISFWVISQPNVNGFCFNMGHFVMPGVTETELMPKHFGRKPYGRNNGRYYGRKAYSRTLLTGGSIRIVSKRGPFRATYNSRYGFLELQ